MRLADARQLAIAEELADARKRRSSDLLAAAFSSLIFGALFGLSFFDPHGWAKGAWFRPGGWPHDTFGFDGSVWLLRSLAGGVAAAGLIAWVRVALDLRAGLPRRRAAIERRLLELERQARGAHA
jgi:hypothetical protein